MIRVCHAWGFGLTVAEAGDERFEIFEDRKNNNNIRNNFKLF